MSHKLIVKIDVRERELYNYCKHVFERNSLFSDINFVSENLPLGDVIIADDIEDKIIIERKSLADLSASIKDGRYNEQSYRLNGIPHHNHNIIYLIEGDISKYNIFKGKMDKMTLYSAMFSINYYKGFSVMRSNCLEETADIIYNMVYKMLKSVKKPFYSNTPNNVVEQKHTVETNHTVEENPTVEQNHAVGTTETSKIETTLNTENTTKTEPITSNAMEEESSSKDYCSVVKKIKKENVTQDNIGEIMLCQIPGISSVTAIAILSKFGTLPKLIMELNANIDCLQDISYTTSAGQKRKINKSCIESIKKFLLTQ